MARSGRISSWGPRRTRELKRSWSIRSDSELVPIRGSRLSGPLSIATVTVSAGGALWLQAGEKRPAAARRREESTREKRFEGKKKKRNGRQMKSEKRLKNMC